ncbi:hypothetical protein [Variovorax sp. LjRoot84]|uniref:hypothetical protein n=1 Tax=Variovorax sp. LjRoot84 TaxID=3342340 RepID=UPI003F519401
MIRWPAFDRSAVFAAQVDPADGVKAREVEIPHGAGIFRPTARFQILWKDI